MDLTHDQSPTVKPRRRVPLWFLWTLAAVMLIVSLFVGFWLPWQRRLSLIQEIERIGGSYTIDSSSGPEWIRELLGHPYHGFAGNPKLGPFDDVIEIDFSQSKGRANSGLSPEFVTRLAQFPNLKKLDLSYSNVTDDWMPSIAQLRDLEKLDMGHCRISGRGFPSLRSLPRLKSMNLAYCPLRDPGLEHLAEISTIKTIGVVRCSHLTDPGMEKFTRERPDCNLYRGH